MYNKLVRDKFIDNMNLDDEKKVVYRILNDQEYEEELNKKLLNEVNEYILINDETKFAEILETMYSIMEVKGVSRNDIEALRLKKVGLEGRFENKLYLENVESR